jgi:hypothetical protein
MRRIYRVKKKLSKSFIRTLEFRGTISLTMLEWCSVTVKGVIQKHDKPEGMIDVFA